MSLAVAWFSQVSVPWGRVVHPAAADHCGDDSDVGEVVWRADDWIAAENRQVGKLSGHEPTPIVLLPAEPGRLHGARLECLDGCQGLLWSPRLSVVEGSRYRRTDSYQRVEVSERCVGAVDDHRPRVRESAKCETPLSQGNG